MLDGPFDDCDHLFRLRAVNECIGTDRIREAISNLPEPVTTYIGGAEGHDKEDACPSEEGEHQNVQDQKGIHRRLPSFQLSFKCGAATPHPLELIVLPLCVSEECKDTCPQRKGKRNADGDG